MSHTLRIAVADDEPDMCDYFEGTLPSLGHQVVGVAKTGRELIELCRTKLPDLVITDIKMPGTDGIDAAIEITRARPIAIILLSAHHDAELLARAEADHIMAYLIKPIKQADLEAAIVIAMRRFAQFQELSKEAATLRQALQDRKVIERAKGILMRRAGLDEESAFRRMQKLASAKNRKLVEIAQIMLISEEALTATDEPH
jgi:response regulator NasT